MTQSYNRSTKDLPPWVVVGGSVLIILHFLAVGAVVLSAQSGPWWVPQLSRESPALGPKFIETVGNNAAAYYLEPLRLSQSYHFNSNRLGTTSVIFFEAKLRDEQGKVIKTITYPDKENDNFWLAHRYSMLGLRIGNDQVFQPRGAEVLPAPGAKTTTVVIWDTSNPKFWKLKTELEHLVPKTTQVWQPSEASLLWAKAFQRYLLRENSAASVELIRHSRNPILPDYMYMKENELPPETFNELVCSFGEYRREK